MRNPDDFDAFYKAAQHRLLLQTFALTGDLPAARSAVRDAFVAAWHHWRKVSRLEDPEAWVRPHAWQHAQRRHTARIWHRDKTLDPAQRATLEALAKLTPAQRRTLLLTHLARVSMEEMAREAGFTDLEAGQHLQSATAQFALKRDVPSSSIREHLLDLAIRTNEARFPRPSIVRRAGAARRRAHTLAGVAATVAALVIAGTVVGVADGVAPGLRDVRASGSGPVATPSPAAGLHMEDLLTAGQAEALAPSRTFREARTDDNTAGRGIYTACQATRYADPDGVGALVRRFSATGKPALSALQVVEKSADPRAATTAYATTVSWYSGCLDERVQLLSAHQVTGAGDAAVLLVLRRWNAPVTTYSVGIARTGSLVTSVVREAAGQARPSLKSMSTVLGSAVAGLCGAEGAGTCTGRVRSREIPPPPAERARGMLQVVDLPPVSGVMRPWVGTDPVRPKVNPAATSCDEADFTGKAFTWSATRSFLVPQASLPRSFGLSQTVGRLRDSRSARQFTARLRARMTSCEDRDLSAQVRQLARSSGPRTEVTAWHLSAEISENRVVDYYVAVIRRDEIVAQVGFIPAPGAGFERGAFVALCVRARDRLANLPTR
jgi:DNA-directed RNA polymerase specialized sigma24 family protein